MEIFADFQGFKNANNQFIVKEFAIASADGTLLQHWMVKSPCPYADDDFKTKEQCTWNTDHYHGIRWQDGDITMQALRTQLFPIFDRAEVYVKGLEKANYIKKLFKYSTVTELEDFPSLKSLTSKVYCFYHATSKEEKMCALNNVLKLVHYWEASPTTPP